MSDPLLGPRIKLDRANHHLVELERIERKFFDHNPCRIIIDPDPKTGHKLAKIILNATPPEIMHVLAGELIYQLRSALDQTAVAFARLSKGPTKPKSVHFPSGDSPRGFLSSCASFDRKNSRLVGNLRHFDSDLRKAILKTRPYDGGNETLRAVFRMANIDKHMELIAIGTTGGISLFDDFTIENAHTGLIVSGPGNLNEGVVFSDLGREGTITPNRPDSKIQVSGQITLGKSAPAFEGKPLVPFLSAMIKEVWRAHLSFEDLLIARGDMHPRIIYWPPPDNTLTRGGRHRPVTPGC